MNRKHRLGFSWLAIVLCMALLMTGMPFATAFAKGKDKKETYYTIKWKVNGETVKKDKVKKGEKPEKPQDPADYSDGKYTYVFSGWEPKVTKATKDMTYKAKFKKTDRKFIITWLDDKGKLIDFTEVKYGKLPTHEDPKKKASEKYTYTFDGWEPELVKAKEDATYTATFKKEARKYKITWVDDEGNVIDQTKVAYGKLPTHEDPVKKSGKAAYTFTGWEPEVIEVTGDATYTATFKKAEFYTITWLDDEGNVIDITEVEPGKKPTHDDPTKEASAEYTYTFAGWTPKIVKAREDATYTATFRQKVRKYTVTWLDDEGNVIDETRVAYGEMPTHADPTLEDTDEYSYVFRGWEPALTEVTGDATYTAVFDEIPKQTEATESPEEPEVPAEPEAPTEPEAQQPAVYTITWLDDEGDVIDTTTVEEGELPTHAAPERPDTDGHSYTFVGWDPEPVPATADASYTAVFTETLKEETVPETQDPDDAIGNSVEIIFKYVDDTIIDFPQKYVETDEPIQVYYTGTEPVKAEDASNAYVWIGWTSDKTKPTVAQYGKSRNVNETPLLPVVTADTPAETVYYAVFQAIPLYTITWNNDDGTQIEQTKVAEGRKPTHEDPIKAGYIFKGWVPEGGGAPIPTADLPVVAPNETHTYTYTAYYEGNANVFDITWIIDGIPEIVPFEAGAQPTHDMPTKAGYEFAGWADAQGTLYQFNELPVVTAAATYTAQWKKAVKLDAVYCYAFIKTSDDKESAKMTYLPSKATLKDGSKLELDWSSATLENYVPLKGGEKNDGTYTYSLNHPEKNVENSFLVVTCNLIVGPKQSETVDLDKKENKKYTYRWDSIVKDAKDAKAMITAWEEKEKEDNKTVLTIASIIDGMEVTAIEKEAFKGKKLTAIIVPAGVTAIEKGAFDDCTELTDLTLPDSLTSIGMDIAKGSKKLINKKLSVAMETTMGKDVNGNYTIKHVIEDKTDPQKKEMSQMVTLPAGFPTEIEITGTGDLKLEITWLDDTGAIADTTYVTYGATPTHAPLTKEPADKYTWNGWDPEPKAVYWPTSYKATFIDKDGLYTIIFVDEDGKTELWRKEDYKYDDQPVYGGDPPTKAPDGEHSYIFEGWVGSDKKLHKVGTDLPKVTADETYTAQYMEGKPVELEAKYTGSGLTKVYDLNKYGAYTKDGQIVYVIEALKTIKEQFKLELVKDNEWVKDHKNVGFRLTLSKQFDSADVGSYEFEFKVTLTGDDAAFYKLKDAVVKVPATITPREVVITPRAGLNKAYGTKDPVYPEGSWLSNDESSPLHQNISGVPGYGVPVNMVDGKLSLSVTNATYLLKEAELKGTKFFPGDNPWLVREEGEDVGKYKIRIGGMSFGKNFTTTLKDEVFTITPKNIADTNVIVNNIPDQQYTGREITLDKDKLVVKYGDKTLVEGTDFTTEYRDNKEVSTDSKKATVTLTGKGNYSGTREATFKIIKTTNPDTPGGGGSSGGSSGSSRSGFGGYGDEEEDENEEGEEGENTWTPSPDGNIKLEDMDYGTVLFGADGKSRPFSQYDEEYEPEIEDTEDEEEEFEDFGDEDDDTIDLDDEDADNEGGTQTTLRRVMIKADWMKETDEEGVEQDVLLEGTDRKRYEELHLRLTDSVIQGLINNGVGEIVYELEQARVRIPLSALSSVITLPADEPDEGADVPGDDFNVDDEIEIEDDDETVEVESADDIDDGADIPVDADAEGQTLPVDGYDIVIEQADANGLSQRETALIADNKTLMPAYRLRVRIIPENAQQRATGERDENNLPITVPATETLPGDYTLPGVVLLLEPDVSYEYAPEEAQVLYVSEETQVDENVDGSAEDADATELDADATELDADATELDADPTELEADPAELGVDEAMVANNQALASAIDSGEATLNPAVFNEEETPIKVEVKPVVDGLYVTLVPADWDPTPYLPKPQETAFADEGEEQFEEVDEDGFEDEAEFEEVDDAEDEDLEMEFEDEEEELVEF